MRYASVGSNISATCYYSFKRLVPYTNETLLTTFIVFTFFCKRNCYGTIDCLNMGPATGLGGLKVFIEKEM